MSLIEGIGDEVTNFFVIIFSSIILYFAWRSTNVREERIPRNLIIIESNRRRLLGRVAQNPITISIRELNYCCSSILLLANLNNYFPVHSTSQQSTVSNEIVEEINTEDESLTPDDSESNVPSNIHIQEAPTLEAILDEVGELTTGGSTFTQANRDQEQIEIIREMDRDDTDGIRHRRTTATIATQSNLTDNDSSETLTPVTATSSSAYTSTTNLAAAAPKSRLNHQDSTDKAANTENCTNENSENGNVFEDLPYDATDTTAAIAAAPTVTAPVDSAPQIESTGTEFRIKLKYLNDELKLVKGCPNEFIGDFKK